MSEISLRVETKLPTADSDQIIHSLVHFNCTQAPPAHHRELAVVAHQGAELIGGLLGYTNWNWLFIRHLWVADAARSQGLSTRLMRAAEQAALQRGCAHAHCDTFDFQALPFYQKLGYTLFGQLDDYPAGHTRYFLQKRHLDASLGVVAN